VRLGTPALTTRGLVESDIDQVVAFIDQGLQLAKEIKTASPGIMLKDFTSTMNSDVFKAKINSLKEKVEDFAEKFIMPGHAIY